jgi:hypothetical protein
VATVAGLYRTNAGVAVKPRSTNIIDSMKPTIEINFLYK